MNAGGTNNSGGMNNSGGTAGGSAGTGGNAGVGGAACPSNCDDQNDCTVDSCVAGACKNEPLAAGKACGTGRTCDESAVCVRCRDTAAGKGQDEGCTAGAPVCTGTGTAATCAGCTKDLDCDDGNECTTEKCTAGSCVVSAVAAGQACSAGVCNGAANAEKCVACLDDAIAPAKDSGCTPAAPACDTTGSAGCYSCVKDADCASDGVACTNDTCTNHVCKHVADDTKCTASGNVCKPNRCDATLDCKQVDITLSSPLIQAGKTLGNGSFEDGVDQGDAVGWSNNGDDYVIYNCTGLGCIGSSGTTLSAPGDGILCAWFGGTTVAAVDELVREIMLPPGTQTLHIQADTNVQTKSVAATNHDFFDIRFLDPMSLAQVGATVVTLTNATGQTGGAVAWTANGIDKTVDATALPSSVLLSLHSSVDAPLKTDFFIDNVRVTATVCQ